MSSVVPEGWVSTTIGEATSEISDGGTPATSNAEYFNGSIPWVVIDDIQPRIVHTKSSITELGLQKSSAKLWDKGTIILSTGATIGEVGIATKAMATKQGICGVVVKSDVSAKYFYHLLVSKKRQLNILSQGSTIKETRPPTVKKIQICLPPLPEQKKIASILTSVDEVIENTQKQIDKLQDLKKATMNELLTKGIGHTEFKDSELGRIPKSWKEVSLGKLIDKLLDFRGRTPKKLGLDWGGGKIKALSANNVKMGRVDFEKECYLASNELYEKWMTKGDSRKDDVLFTMEAPLGNVCLVPDNNRYILSQRVILFRVNKLILPSYIHHTLASQYFQNTLVKHSTGTTATGIQQKNLVKLKLLVPSSIEEQQKIASIITSVDKKIEYIQKKLSQTQSLKKSLMQELLTGKVRVTVN